MSHNGTPSDRRPDVSRWELFCWALYDWSSNAFPTIVQTFLFAAYFTGQVAEDETTGTTLWGGAIGLAGMLVALGGPVMGAVTDQTGRRKPWIATATALCIVATLGLWFVRPSTDYIWLALILVGIGTIGSEYANLFYNAMLPDLADPEETGRWSGWAFGMGYGGGLACLAVALLLFVGFDIEQDGLDEASVGIRASAFLVAGWFLVFSVPFFLVTRDTQPTGMPLRRAFPAGWNQLVETFRNIREYRHLVRFLIARLVYVDALATVFVFGGVFAAGTFGMSTSEILMFGIALNVSAGVGAVAFSWVDDWIGGKRTIVLALIGLLIPVAIVLFVESVTAFWICCLTLGVFVGPVQSASRSFLARTAPPDLKNEAFGLYTFSGKATAFVGPLMVSGLTLWSGSQRVGMSMVAVELLIGLVIIAGVPRDK